MSTTGTSKMMQNHSHHLRCRADHRSSLSSSSRSRKENRSANSVFQRPARGNPPHPPTLIPLFGGKARERFLVLSYFGSAGGPLGGAVTLTRRLISRRVRNTPSQDRLRFLAQASAIRRGQSFSADSRKARWGCLAEQAGRQKLTRWARPDAAPCDYRSGGGIRNQPVPGPSSRRDPRGPSPIWPSSKMTSPCARKQFGA